MPFRPCTLRVAGSNPLHNNSRAGDERPSALTRCLDQALGRAGVVGRDRTVDKRRGCPPDCSATDQPLEAQGPGHAVRRNAHGRVPRQPDRIGLSGAGGQDTGADQTSARHEPMGSETASAFGHAGGGGEESRPTQGSETFAANSAIGSASSAGARSLIEAPWCARAAAIRWTRVRLFRWWTLLIRGARKISLRGDSGFNDIHRSLTSCEPQPRRSRDATPLRRGGSSS